MLISRSPPALLSSSFRDLDFLLQGLGLPSNWAPGRATKWLTRHGLGYRPSPPFIIHYTADPYITTSLLFVSEGQHSSSQLGVYLSGRICPFFTLFIR